ncbi:hypothetical protein EV182_006712 [Spiromyces aspiralis]|uniref:Uncharacterized protein n=1 Tax=Spiromyces aspiralis TaxID=68401 RepID=A0ACC1HLV9_9FUNG|nr:hypothetical protein EV182_006712 [Spiromyces aspiralis]
MGYRLPLPKRTLLIRFGPNQLPNMATSMVMYDHFSKYGKIDKLTRQNIGLAYITYEKQDEAADAAASSEHTISDLPNNKPFKVTRVESRPLHPAAVR